MDDGGWFLVMAVATPVMAGFVVRRGYFDMPLHGRITRADDPASFWIICALIGFLGPGSAALSLFI